MAGYSETPLAKKLGIKAGARLYVPNAPSRYLDLLDPLPDDVLVVPKLSTKVDVAHLFVTLRVDLALHLQRCLKSMQDDAAIWVSWPKKASKVPTDITERTIRDVALPMGLVDIKVCAVDEVWSGLKLVVRKENRASSRP